MFWPSCGLGNLGEVAWVAEVFVDAREANVGDVVEGLEANHHRFANAPGFHLVAERFHLPLNAADQAIDPGRVDVTLAASMADRAGEFVAVERFALAVFLDDGEVAQLHALERREASAAGLALAPAPDRRPVLGRATVLYLAVFMGTERAAHQL